MTFFMLTLNVILTLPVNKKDYNALILLTCKFSKKVIFIEKKDTFIAKECVHIFFARLNLID